MSTVLDRLRDETPLIAVEMRPPRADLHAAATIDAWLGMGRAVRRLSAAGGVLFFTDNATGTSEEENLHHLVSNLEGLARLRLCPFLTTKHTLQYCLWYADRAVQDGHAALTVLGGDPHVGPPRCVPHANGLRQKIRDRHPTLALGGWANTHRDARAQVGYLAAPDAAADFFLTQVVSHHDLAPVERFVREARARELELPGVYGVFYYRSANPKTLALLERFLPVPKAEITRDFGERGLTADQICARTIRALRDVGVRHVYVSNLRPDDADERLAAIEALVRG
jgi:5,10-methylenetetrahydrofolate reductase